MCQALKCSKEILETWISNYPSFKNAIDFGLIDGEVIFRDKVSKIALKPTSKINTKLILTLANNVYGIKDEIQQVLIDKSSKENESDKDVEKTMRERGIPIPKIELDDLDD